jgi:hypothetical protein
MIEEEGREERLTASGPSVATKYESLIVNHLGDLSPNQLKGDIPGWLDLRLVFDPGILTKPAFPWNPPLGARERVREEISKNLQSLFDSGLNICSVSLFIPIGMEMDIPFRKRRRRKKDGENSQQP